MQRHSQRAEYIVTAYIRLLNFKHNPLDIIHLCINYLQYYKDFPLFYVVNKEINLTDNLIIKNRLLEFRPISSKGYFSALPGDEREYKLYVTSKQEWKYKLSYGDINWSHNLSHTKLYYKKFYFTIKCIKNIQN